MKFFESTILGRNYYDESMRHGRDEKGRTEGERERKTLSYKI